MNLLLTGFESFGEVKTNPSQLIVEALVQALGADLTGLVTSVRSAVLPVEFAAAGERIRALIEETRPNIILMLGVAAKRETISLERVALNVDDSPRPDNAGSSRDGTPIDPDGPLALAATLPLIELRAALAGAGVPVAISNHAGTYVCNHAFYVALRTVERLGLAAACGFIHVPLPRDLQPDALGAFFALADLVAAVRRIIVHLSL